MASSSATICNNMNPLLIPEVLEQVFSYLYPETLRECRLVSKVWEMNVPLSPNWTKYYVIHYQKSEDNQLLLETERIPSGDGTIKPIFRKALLRPNNYGDYSYYVPQTCFLKNITALAIEAYQGFAPKLVDILNQLKDNLIQLSITEMEGGPSWGYLNEEGLAEVPQFPSMRKLSYSVDQCSFYRELFPLQMLFQRVILNSPGLEEVEIWDNIFPNFENSRNLRTLLFHGQTFELGYDYDMDVCPVDNERFSDQEFQRVLDQVKDHIEILDLGDSSVDSDGIPEIAESLILPKFNNVKTLSVAVDLYLQNPSVSLAQLFPGLRNLKLSGRFTGSSALDKWAEMEDREEVMGTLRNLEIQGNPKLDTMQTISRKFPNLKKLTCYSEEPFYFVRDKDSKSFLKVCLRSIFSDWSLEYAKFVVKGGCLLTLLSAVKSLPQNLSGIRLTRLEIEFPWTCSHKDDKEKFDQSDEELTQKFLLFKDIDIQITGVSECAELPGFLDFVQENGLRILIKPNA